MDLLKEIANCIISTCINWMTNPKSRFGFDVAIRFVNLNPLLLPLFKYTNQNEKYLLKLERYIQISVKYIF